jgi:hypothetical protein
MKFLKNEINLDAVERCIELAFNCDDSESLEVIRTGRA